MYRWAGFRPQFPIPNHNNYNWTSTQVACLIEQVLMCSGYNVDSFPCPRRVFLVCVCRISTWWVHCPGSCFTPSERGCWLKNIRPSSGKQNVLAPKTTLPLLRYKKTDCAWLKYITPFKMAGRGERPIGVHMAGGRQACAHGPRLPITTSKGDAPPHLYLY